MNIPTDPKYTKNDEWVRVSAAPHGGANRLRQGVIRVAFVELERGATFKQGRSFAAVRSVKATSGVYMPVGGGLPGIGDSLGDAGSGQQRPVRKAWMVSSDQSPNSIIDGRGSLQKNIAPNAHTKEFTETQVHEIRLRTLCVRGE